MGLPVDSSLRDKIRLPKVEHRKFEGYMTPNEDNHPKSVQLKFKYCLGVSLHVY